MHALASRNVKRFLAIPKLQDSTTEDVQYFADLHTVPNPERFTSPDVDAKSLDDLAGRMCNEWQPPPLPDLGPAFSSGIFFSVEWHRIMGMLQFRLLRPGVERATSAVDETSFINTGTQLIWTQPPALKTVTAVDRKLRENKANNRAVVVLDHAELTALPRQEAWIVLPSLIVNGPVTLATRLGPKRVRPALKLHLVWHVARYVGPHHFLFKDPAKLFCSSVQELIRVSSITPDSKRTWPGAPTVPSQMKELKKLTVEYPRVPVRTLSKRLRLRQEFLQAQAEAADAQAARSTGQYLFSFAMSCDARRMQTLARSIAPSSSPRSAAPRAGAPQPAASRRTVERHSK